jgi:hypothetical protein
MGIFLTLLIVAIDAPVRTREELNAEKGKYFAIVETLHKLATALHPYFAAHAKSLATLADSLKEEIEPQNRPGPFTIHKDLIVERDRGDPTVRGFVRLAVIACRTTFGSPLYSTVATITNVVFDRGDITRDRVYSLVRERATDRCGVKRRSRRCLNPHSN